MATVYQLYAANKAAVVALARSLAAAYRVDNINLTSCQYALLGRSHALRRGSLPRCGAWISDGPFGVPRSGCGSPR